MRLDKDLLSLISKVSNRNSISSKDLELAFDHFIHEMGKKMEESTTDIMIHNIGRYNLEPRYITRAIQILEEGEQTEEVINKIKHLEELREVVKNKKHKRKC